jgi:hypothetical protein
MTILSSAARMRSVYRNIIATATVAAAPPIEHEQQSATRYNPPL